MSIDMSISALQRAFAEGRLTPAQLMADIRRRAAEYEAHNIWIHLLTAEEQQPWLEALAQKDPASHPLWGIPFAIKDNIDLAGIPTTAACPTFAYTPESSAQVVQQLIDAGAIPVGKTNLDQFATGLNGTRSPYGPCRNAFDSDYISGGSSSGSAVAVALGLASFSLGTDTAGSGRVPACFNNLVGLKPTRGLLSSTGLVPACRSLDCISIFTLDTDDANTVLACAEGFDARDGYSRRNGFDNAARQYGLRSGPLRIGVLPQEQLKFFGSDHYARAYADTLAALTGAGIELVTVDFTPFDEAARLLYEGPWVAERYIACESLLNSDPEAIHPVVRAIIEPGKTPPATDLFRAQYRLQELRLACFEQMEGLDCLLTPTAGRLFRVDEMLAEPVRFNSQLGYYTNFMNLLDMAAVAIPTAFTAQGLPFGVTLVGDHFSDRRLLSIGNRIRQILPLPQGALGTEAAPTTAPDCGGSERTDLLVCGAHLQELPLNWQLTERGAVLKARAQTAACYRLFALAGGPPLRPGLMRDESGGRGIEVEVWSIPTAELGSFVAAIPAPLGIGKVELADGRWVSGFICEASGLKGAEEITHYGGWRNWLQSQ
ncbi:allophanate hydrolase [Microbulbifer thermotolerans]|uniref:Allophanate hydrolase n=1 Tax=Microbulbifer thermotolerans TaxID=252514 RepID=A0AB35HX57_MICTH|nr:allophanate hydrolase [Microbulbifer thermotolerans]MCX2779684.1 allophanate hydrolase [Microbulbifer thermotolerans]MCX2801491.1 allophanate hydrolase [Microbulbifer thermotolerans]MCX2804885.1 allophanate hydrolase [Microbulbifer thermotolerans]MCX2831752.1 allophanate hydrolase [Microbulbifer thermotolerans]MCX2833841.1 allophanate hydrolase [Microbulbifer thermotolerans]